MASRTETNARCRYRMAVRTSEWPITSITIADLVRCNLLPACKLATPRIRELRRLLRYRSLV
jgi:hypothetical protein